MHCVSQECALDGLPACLPADMNLLDAPEYPQRLVRVSCQHVGSFSFKGCGDLDVVAFTTDSTPGKPVAVSGSRAGGKATLILPKSGPVVGLQDCPILLPQVLPALQRAWAAATDVAATVEHTRMLRKQVTQHSFELFRTPPEVQRTDATLVPVGGSSSSNVFRRRSLSLALTTTTTNSSGSRLPVPKLPSASDSAGQPTANMAGSNTGGSHHGAAAGAPEPEPATIRSIASGLIERTLGSFTQTKATVKGVRGAQGSPLAAVGPKDAQSVLLPAGDGSLVVERDLELADQQQQQQVVPLAGQV